MRRGSLPKRLISLIPEDYAINGNILLKEENKVNTSGDVYDKADRI